MNRSRRRNDDLVAGERAIAQLVVTITVRLLDDVHSLAHHPHAGNLLPERG